MVVTSCDSACKEKNTHITFKYLQQIQEKHHIFGGKVMWGVALRQRPRIPISNSSLQGLKSPSPLVADKSWKSKWFGWFLSSRKILR